MIVRKITIPGIGERKGLNAKHTYHFDECGRLTLEVHSGEREERIEHLYQPDGNEYESRSYQGGELVTRTVFEYDEEGGQLGSKEFDGKDGRLLKRFTIDWRKSGNVAAIDIMTFSNGVNVDHKRSMRRYFMNDGRPVYEIDGETSRKWEYDSAGNLTCIKDFISEESGNRPKLTAWKTFDEKGLPTEAEYKGERINFRYLFDDHGNWTVAEGWQGDHLEFVSFRMIEYGPGEYRPTSHDANSDILSHVSRV